MSATAAAGPPGPGAAPRCARATYFFRQSLNVQPVTYLPAARCAPAVLRVTASYEPPPEGMPSALGRSLRQPCADNAPLGDGSTLAYRSWHTPELRNAGRAGLVPDRTKKFPRSQPANRQHKPATARGGLLCAPAVSEQNSTPALVGLTKRPRQKSARGISRAGFPNRADHPQE